MSKLAANFVCACGGGALYVSDGTETTMHKLHCGLCGTFLGEAGMLPAENWQMVSVQAPAKMMIRSLWDGEITEGSLPNAGCKVFGKLSHEDLKAIEHARDNSPVGTEFTMFDANKLVRIGCDERGRIWKDGKLIYGPKPDSDEPLVVEESPK